MVRGDRLFTEPVAQPTRHALRHAPRVDEYECRSMRLDERGQPLVVFLPDFVRHHGVERRARHLDTESMCRVCPAPRWCRPPPLDSDQKAGDLFNRLLRGRQPYAL